jgi:phage replication O-like protein O
MSAGPQLEDGFVRIANELLEAILRFDLSHREQSVVLTIIRKTYGYGKKEDDISATQIGELCGIARPHVTAALNQLALRNVITKRAGRFGSIIGIQKNYRKWVGLDQMKSTIDSTDSVQGCTDLVHVPIQYTGSTESVQVDSTDSVHTKDNLPKDNHQKKTSCAPLGEPGSEIAIPAGRPGRATTDAKAELQNRFERFYAVYPRKRSRQAAEKAFAKINPDEQLLTAILAGIERAMTSGEWTDSKFIPHPATWLNAAGWQDEIQTAYTDAELLVIGRFNDALGDRLGHVQTVPFLAERADAIKAFTTFSEKPGFIDRFFAWAGANVDFPPSVGFDWLISRKGYTNATSGQHSKRAP